jgi:hypothetical protein
MASLVNRSVRSVLALALLAAAACSDSGRSISGVEPVGAAAAGKAKPTEITVSTSSYLCGTLYGSGFTISPYCTGGPFGGFQSTAGTGGSSSIYMYFSSPVSSVTLRALDPDYIGNFITAYDGYGQPVDYEMYDYDNAPGSYTTSTKTVTGSGITMIALSPNSSDYIAYDSFSFY